MAGTALFYDLVRKLILEALKKGAAAGVMSLITRAKVNGALDLCVARVIEPLEIFFAHEGLDDRKQELLALACTDELRPLLEDPQLLFKGSLDGQKLFDQLYDGRMFPQAVRDEGIEHAYRLVFPRIAHMLCQYPPLFERWKVEGWREDFRRLDELSEALSDVGKKVDALAAGSGLKPEDLLSRVRQGLLQRVAFTVDLTGLRADMPLNARPEEMFVVPAIKERINSENPIPPDPLETPKEHMHEVLELDSRMVIEGSPGSGKSTWSQWVQVQGMTSSRSLLFVVRLRKYASQRPSLLTLLREELGGTWGDEIDAKLLRNWIDARALGFIFDGFDEVAPTDRDDMLDWVLELATYFGSCPAVITSRPLTTDHLKRLRASWRHFRMLPFDHPRIVDYIKRWYKYAPLLLETERDVNAAALAASWLRDPVIAPLTDNPLMLATLLMVHHLDGQLPRGRANLYERYIAGMLGLRDSRYGIKSAAAAVTSAEKLAVLTAVAIHFQLKNVDEAGDADMQALVSGVLTRLRCPHPAEDVLSVLRERTGLVIGPGTYSFIHKSVSEFLVAKAIVDGVSVDDCGGRLDRLRLFAERNNDRWNTVIFFWAGLVPVIDLEVFIQELKETRTPKDRSLALGLIADQHDRIPAESAKETIKELLKIKWETAGNPHWIIDGAPPHQNEVVYGLPPLRALDESGQVAFLNLATRVELGWADVKKAPRSHLPALWTAALWGTLRKDAELQQLVAVAKSLKLPDVYCWLLVQTVLHDSLRGTAESREPEAVVDVLRSVAPSYAGIIPLVILCLFDETVMNWRADGIDKTAYIRRACRIIASYQGNPVDEAWLSASSWQPERPPSERDTLQKAQNTLRRWMEDGTMTDTKLAHSVLKYIDNLKEARGKLKPPENAQVMRPVKHHVGASEDGGAIDADANR